MPPIHYNNNMNSEITSSTMMVDDDGAHHHHPLQWTTLLPEIRHEILQYLDEPDLGEFSMVSRQCREECRDKSFSQKRTAVVQCNPNTTGQGFHYLHPLAGALLKVPTPTNNHSSEFAVFEKRFTSFRIEHASSLPKIMNREAKPIIKALSMKHVTRLDMSSPCSPEGKNNNFPQVASSVAKLMTQVTPDVQHVDLSHNQVGTATLADFSRNCEHLTTIRLVGGMLASSVTGMDLKQCDSLKELYLANTLVTASAKESSDVFVADGTDFEENCPFQYCLRHLERVSLKGCRYFSMTAKHDDGVESKPFTQVGLVKLVRNAPNLKWFESDLTPQNVKMLQDERPDVVFVGHEQ